MQLGITDQLAKLCSTNPCESTIEIVRYTQHDLKRWAERRHTQALDRRRDGRRRTAVPADHRLPRRRQLGIAIDRHALLVAEKNRNPQETRQPWDGSSSISRTVTMMIDLTPDGWHSTLPRFGRNARDQPREMGIERVRKFTNADALHCT